MDKKPRITVICPTRERPDGLRRMFESVTENAADPEAVEVRAYVDEDDPTLQAYAALPQEVSGGHRLVVHTGIPRRCVSATNFLCSQARADYILVLPDDVEVLSKGWEAELCRVGDLFSDGMVVLYGKDETSPWKYAHPTITRRLYELWGYFVFPGYIHFGADDWIHHVMSACDRAVSVHAVTMRHRHFLADDSVVKDATYARSHNDHVQLHDHEVTKTLQRYKDFESARVAASIRDFANRNPDAAARIPKPR